MKLLSLFALACAVFAQPALQPSPNCCDPAQPTCMALYTRCVQNAGSTGGTPSSGVCAALLCPSPYPVRMSPSVSTTPTARMSASPTAPPSSKPSASSTPTARMSASPTAPPSSKPSASSTPTARMSLSPLPARPSVTSAPTPQMSVSPPPTASITPATTAASTPSSALTATPASTRTLASTPATTPTPTRRPDTGGGNVSGISGGGSSNNPPNPAPTVSAGEVVAGVIGAFGILAVVSLAYAYYIRGSPRFRPTSPKLRNSPISESNAVYTRNVMHKINI